MADDVRFGDLLAATARKLLGYGGVATDADFLVADVCHGLRLRPPDRVTQLRVVGWSFCLLHWRADADADARRWDWLVVDRRGAVVACCCRPSVHPRLAAWKIVQRRVKGVGTDAA